MTNQVQKAHYAVRYAKSSPAHEIENSEDLKFQLLAERTVSLDMAEVGRSNRPEPIGFFSFQWDYHRNSLKRNYLALRFLIRWLRGISSCL